MFSATNIALIAATLLSAFVFFNPRLRTARLWRATVTPLASIIGSGFLVAGPILAHAAGTWAWLAMLALCAAGYCFGVAIRSNIAHVESANADEQPSYVAIIERLSQLALALAYFISVAYYLNLFAAFGLRFGDVTAQLWIRAGATAAIAGIGVLGAVGGLRALENLEIEAVGLKLSVIGGLIVALVLGALIAAFGGAFSWRAPTHPHGANELRIILGLLILVQGFETSRFLGDEYSADERIRSMRLAQIVATAIYAAFILLITQYFSNGLPDEGGETAIIDMLAPLGAALAPMIIIAALASQLSAAVADLNGAGGLIAESSKKRVPVRFGNLIAAGAAIAITWTANIYEIIAYASQAFVIFYALPSLQAKLSATRRGNYGAAAFFGVLVLFGLVILIFARPASV